MPGIDFDRLRREIPMEQVLNLIHFEPKTRTGHQWYGRCPLHPVKCRGPRSFSVNVQLKRYHCHQHHSGGNQIELWAELTNLTFYHAAIDLCRALGREVPWIKKW
jgi:DNA primase